MFRSLIYPCKSCRMKFGRIFEPTCWEFSKRSIFSLTGIWEEELTKDTKVKIEQYWRDKINLHNDHSRQSDKPKFYVLSMFPYPSGKLHMGHVRVYVTSDAIARFHRMMGKQVIHPMGWDSFGLPAENAAIHHGERPDEWTDKNIAHMKKQMEELGCSFDWDRELSTCKPDYYRWTQYIFLKMFEKGLAYQKEALVNWDPVDKTVLANEQVDENGCSWRSGAKVDKVFLKQWFLRTTDFSKDLYDGLSDPSLGDWRDITSIQRHWLGDCSGCRFTFTLECNGEQLKDSIAVWTQTPEHIYGASFIGLSSSHVLNKDINYCSNQINAEEKKLKICAIHPFTGDKLPIFISDSLEFPEGTDSYIGYPGENEADAIFANKHILKSLKVTSLQSETDSRHLINSNKFSGLSISAARDAICSYAREHKVGGYFTSSKLRDWLISRQRYWGTPIPIIHCDKCHVVPVPYEDLPVILPQIKDSKSGLLRDDSDWINVKCPRCGCEAKRETDTMDTFVDSSWYYLRFLDSKNQEAPFNQNIINKDMPVDIYIGGKEHAVLHLYFARFVNHFLHREGMVSHKEPFTRLLVQGIVMGQTYRSKETGRCLIRDEVDFSGSNPVEKSNGMSVNMDWEKMSKSKHNGVDPQGVIDENGIDTTRLFILGDVAPTTNRHWSTDTFPGILNWQWKMWLTMRLFLDVRHGRKPVQDISAKDFKEHEQFLFEKRNYSTKKVTYNFDQTFQLSVALANLQGLTRYIRRVPAAVVKDSLEFEKTLASIIIMSAPFAPCFASELWSGFVSAPSRKSTSFLWDKSVLEQPWPDVDMDYRLELLIKVNGETVKSIKFPREQLDQLTFDEAMRIVEKDAGLAKYFVKKMDSEPPSFEVVPGYSAKLELRIPNMKVKKGKQDKD